MAPRIRQIQTNSNVIRDIPRPIVNELRVPRPVTANLNPPVVSAIAPPIVDVPNPIIDYPTIDVPTETVPPKPSSEPSETTETPKPDTRDLPPTPTPPPPTPTPIIEIGGLDIPLPEPGPLVAAGSLAVVTTAVTLTSTIVLGQVKNAAEPLLKRVLAESAGKKKKIKIKQVKPVLHYIPNKDGSVELIEYSQKGMNILEGNIEKLEQYLRDTVNENSFYEFDNKIIIDEALKETFTKEGQKRFKAYFASSKVIAKKLGAKFSF